MEIKTNCGPCIFYKDKECSLGRREKMEASGVVIEGDIIQNRFCSFQRIEPWGHGLSQEESKIAVMSENLIKTHVFIHTAHWGLLSLKRTMKSLKKQLLPPSGVTIIGTREKLDEVKIPQYMKYGAIKVVLDNNLSKLQCLDTAINNCDSYFYIYINSGFVLPPHFLANIDESVNEKMQRFSFIKGNDEGFMCGASIDLHKKLGGNKAGYLNIDEKEILFATNVLQTKVEYLANKDSQQDYIKNYSDFLNDN